MNKKYLSDQEISKIEQFADDKVMREAVKKVVLEAVYDMGTLKEGKEADPMRNWALVIAQQANEWGHDNEQLGQRLQAVSEGVQRVEQGFGALDNIKADVKEAKSKKNNPAL